MKITMMSTYNQICGIADYTASLVEHFPKEHEIKVIAPKLNTGPYHSLKAVGLEDPRVSRLFNATVWDNIINIELDKIAAIADKSDVFHIQFQDALYHHEWLWFLIERLKNRTKLFITLHDNCLSKIWPALGQFYGVITMKPEVKKAVPQAHLFGMPIYDYVPMIKGFGLGRSRHDEIKKVCDLLGYKYERALASERWMPQEELYRWLRDSDGIVLYYDEVGTAGSSAAARTALGTRRPVFVNTVTWFNDLPENIVIKFNDTTELKEKLYAHFNNKYITDNSFKNIALQHIELYKSNT